MRTSVVQLNPPTPRTRLCRMPWYPYSNSCFGEGIYRVEEASVDKLERLSKEKGVGYRGPVG